MAGTESTETTGPGARTRRIVVVPRAIGPLRDPASPATASSDDLDQLIDEVFGPPPQDRPGIFDAVLVIGGLVLLAWGLATNGGTLPVLVGGTAVVLGLALPLRSLVRAVRRRDAQRRWGRALGTGYALDAGHPATAALVEAYERVLAATELPGVMVDAQAIEPVHAAVVDVATLLGGGPPVGAAQVEYVEKRAGAIGSVADELERGHREWVETQGAAGQRTLRRREAWATAVTEAREELEAGDRHSSLDRLEHLQRELSREPGDARS
jgi:hypothetical protein